MEAVKIGGKTVAVFAEFAIFFVLFFPFMVGVLIFLLIDSAIDNSHYKAKIENTEFYEDNKRKALTDEKIDLDRARRRSCMSYLKQYWITLFGWIFK